MALDTSKALNRVRHAGLLHKLKSYGIPDQIVGLISTFLSNRWLRVVLDEKSLQKYSLKPIQDGPFWGCSGMGVGQKGPPP